MRYGAVAYRFQNYGRVAAILTRLYFTLERPDDAPEPIDPESEMGRKIAYGMIVGPGEQSDEYEASRGLRLTSALRAQKERRRITGQHLFFMEFVRYRDLMGNEFATGFCLLHTKDGFQVASPERENGPDLFNYDRRLSNRDKQAE